MVVVSVLGNDFAYHGYFALILRAACPSEPAATAQGPEPCKSHLGLEGRAFGVSHNDNYVD